MITDINDINIKLKADPEKYVKDADLMFENNIRSVAESIIAQREKSAVVLISGPSGSGKTTSALTLEKMLDGMGHETHTLSMDNYFIPLTAEERRLAAEEKIDLESPERIDIPFLNGQLTDIINCKPVEIPRFDFTENARVPSGRILDRKPGEIVILEGIHALNPEVITVPDNKTVRVYVSVRTRVKTPSGVCVHPEYIRLLRRMVRDCNFRGRSFAETKQMFSSVQRGENRYIMPFKYRSEFDIDTFIPYEVNIFRERLLSGLAGTDTGSSMPDVIDMLKSAYPLDLALIPKHSLIREFVGDSEFKY